MNKRSLYESFHRLRTQSDMAPVREYLQGQLDECKAMLVYVSSEDNFRLVQGRAQAWKHILDLVEQSTSLLDRER